MQVFIPYNRNMNTNNFIPNEIIFSPTNICNLKCSHCYVKQANLKLSIEDAIKFMSSCDETIEKIGFSGGEPFLYKDFICEISKKTVELGLFFDRIMTNGVWWNDELTLQSVLTDIYNSGFDGKIGLSFDSFHNQQIEKIIKFCTTVYEIWNNYSMIEIQSVINPLKNESDIENIKTIAKELNCNIRFDINKKTGKGLIVLSNANIFLPIFRFNQSYESDTPNAWNDKHWFKDDFCQSTGQVLFVHADGTIAPCCGFANENKKILIGDISQTFSQVMENASKNRIVNICYNEGLKKYIKKIKHKGKTQDPCTFCDFLCKHKDI